MQLKLLICSAMYKDTVFYSLTVIWVDLSVCLYDGLSV